MDTLLGVVIVTLGVAFVLWLVSQSSSAQPGASAPGPARPTAAELRRRATGIEFLLEEARRSEQWADIPGPQRAELIARYERELVELQAKAATPAVGPLYTAKAAPARRQPKPRKPMDWSWLAEQQASLFLFAGAFLVVVAALIYVGYSGQALSGALKVALLAAYTVAFLAAGIVCFRTPVVRVAGLVFIGISAVLVPLNFALAGSVIESDFSDEGMWLAGSLASAAFYASVGGLGLGRQYSFTAGIALASAAGATIFLLVLPVEWAPAPFLALAVLIAAIEVAVPQTLRKRVAYTWVWQAHIITAISLAFALVTAIALNQDNEDLSTRWFAAPLAGLGIAFYAIRALRGTGIAVTGCAVSLAGLTSSVVYGADVSPEYYAFALIGAGLALAVAVRSPLPRLAAGLLYSSAATDALVLAHVAAAGGVAVAVVATIIGADPASGFTPDTSWFLLGAFAAAALVYATHLSMPMPAFGEADRLATFGFGLSVAGMAAAVVYGADWSPEYFAFAAVAAAAVLMALATWGVPKAVGEGPPGMRRDSLLLAHAAGLAAASVAVGAVYAAARDETNYEPQTLWFLPALFGVLLAFYGLALWSPFRPSQEPRVAAGLGLVASVFGVTTGLVYALEVSAEYYAFAALGPAIVLGAAAHLAPASGVDDLLPHRWRAGAIGCGRAAAVSGLPVAIIAAFIGSLPDVDYDPDSRAFLPLAFLATAAFFALDASIEKLWAPSAALLATLGGAVVTIVYALEAGAEYYGVGLACVGLAYGFGGRVWSPSWLDERARDQSAVAAVTLGWLPFEGAYEDHLRMGAGTHLAAAVLYTGAALIDRSKLTLDRLLDMPQRVPVRVGAGWLYAAGLTIVIGYLDILRSLPAAEGEEAGSLALPVMGLSLGFLVAGALFRWVRPDLRAHVYIVALLTGVFSLSISKDAVTLAAILSVFVFAYITVAAWENSPILAAPSAVFGFAAVIAWRQEADWALYSIPLAYSGIALGLYAAGFALRPRLRIWGDALRAAGAAFAVASPGVGFGILAADTEAGMFRGDPFETSALYEWSTLATGLVGVLALVESSIARRGWVVVAGSAVMLVAMLLQIGRFHPDNIQAYTAVIGAYLVLLGLVGLSRYRLIPGLDESAVYVEALGAAVVMFPSFLQSIDGGWRYELILLVEAAGFFTTGVVLQRRGLLGTSLGGLVLVGGRVLFDALNALPNWIVALIIGMALLATGLGIMIGRERWTRWEERVASWWGQTGAPHPR